MSKERNSPFEIRGLMFDPARQMERHDFYFKLLPDLARWGYNTLWWHFLDDEGFAQKLQSHPELASPFAFSLAEIRRFVKEARRRGIDVVPEVESLGHTLSITRHPRFRHLFNGRPYGHNAICPSHPDSLQLMREIIPEIAALFPSLYLHAGLDEVDLYGCPVCARRSRGRPPWWIYAQYVLAIHQIVTACNRRMIMWADAVEEHPELLKVLPKDIILAHWHYDNVPPEVIIPSVEAGFDILCVPAISGPTVQPDAAALKNNDDMIALARRLGPRHVRGVVTCWWEPFQSLRDAFNPAMAYAGAALQKGAALDKPVFFRDFARDFFGAKSAGIGKALWDLHVTLPSFDEFKSLHYDSLVDLHEALKLAEQPAFDTRLKKAREIFKTLLDSRAKVGRHRAEFNTHILSARIVAAGFDNVFALLQAYRLLTKALGGAEVRPYVEPILLDIMRDALRLLEDRGRPLANLAADVAREWDRTRYPGDRKKDNSSDWLRGRARRALLACLMRGVRFNRELTQNLSRAILAYKQGGPPPFGLSRMMR